MPFEMEDMVKREMDSFEKNLLDQINLGFDKAFGGVAQASNKPLTKQDLMFAIDTMTEKSKPVAYKLVESPYMIDTVRVKKHKKWRTDKKWLKRYGYFNKPKTQAFMVGDTIIAHPVVARKLRVALRNEGWIDLA